MLTLDTIQNATVVPAEAVQAGQQGQFVYVVKAGQQGRASRAVTPGRTFGKKMVIEKGIAPGDTVVTDGQLRLFPGAQVQTVDPAQTRSGEIMNLSRIFIERPVMTALISFAILLFGAIAFRALPVAALPSVDYPTIQVSAAVPGASPETMASIGGHAAGARVLHHRRHHSR